ncbi:MAG: FGGY-family carbohydrate kinase, partial [Actinomycetota bacterium]|nr:FGGY-family carbohydrate kinase [Actinomycetota bacterium]
TGTVGGLTRTNMSPENIARAAVEGMLCGLADGLDALRDNGVPVDRVLLIGGGARSAAVQSVARGVLGVPVAVPTPGEYVALGAARQAAWALAGRQEADEPPQWAVRETGASGDPGHWGREVRERYASLRTRMHGV